jgi:hypothetical protein
MRTRHTVLAALCGVLAVGAAFAAEPPAASVDPAADALLRAACANLAEAKAFSFRAEVWEDAIVDGHKVASTRTVEAQVRHPDRLQVEIRSAGDNRGFWYDGKTLTLLDRSRNLYGSVPVPETIDKVLDAANDQFGINLPLEDLIVNDPYASASAAIKEGAYFGKVTVLGTPCQHIAFSTDEVDWQLWIQDGPRPLIRKLIITYKQEDTAPQYTAIFSDWKLRGGLSDKIFVFTPPKAAAQIGVLPAADTE